MSWLAVIRSFYLKFLFQQKIYVFLWFWLLILTAITGELFFPQFLLLEPCSPTYCRLGSALQRSPPHHSPSQERTPQDQSSSARQGSPGSGSDPQISPRGGLEGFLHSRYQHGTPGVRGAHGGILRTARGHIS